MTELDTERRLSQDQWIDRLSPDAQLALMLDSQAQASGAVRSALPQIAQACDALYARFSRNETGRLVYCGAGTSARIAVQDGAELRPTFNWPETRTSYIIAGGMGALTKAVEGAEDSEDDAKDAVISAAIGGDDCVIGLAASGQTGFTCAALEAAQDAGAVTIAISNNPDSRLLATGTYQIVLATGAEALAGSTRLKAGTAQKICLNLISTQLMVRLGYVKDGLMTHMIPANEKLRRRKQQIEAMLAEHSR